MDYSRVIPLVELTARTIGMTLDSGEEYQAKVIGTDDETDLAVLKIEAGHDLSSSSRPAAAGAWG